MVEYQLQYSITNPEVFKKEIEEMLKPYKTKKYVEDYIPEKVIFNGMATVCYWKDGSRTVVKCTNEDFYSEETGVALCIAKKVFGENRSEFLRVVKSAYHQPAKKEKLVAENVEPGVG